MTPIPLSTQKSILNSFKSIKKHNDVSKLSPAAYNFIRLASGFIAHFNRYGFIQYYNSASDLFQDILDNQCNNQWDNFRKGEESYDYYLSKKEVYNQICQLVK